MVPAFDGSDDLVWIGGPSEGFRLLVVLCNEAVDRRLEDGRIEVGSNVVERSIKSVALTRKNSLFVGNARGGKTFAVLASLVNTCKLNGVDPEAWLADVLERIIAGKVAAKRMETLFPWA